jgi:hypothetical protein
MITVLIKLISTLLGKEKLCPHYGGRNCGLLGKLGVGRDMQSVEDRCPSVFPDRFVNVGLGWNKSLKKF